MASSKPQCSDSAVLPEESSLVQVLDSNEPLVTASSSVLSSAQVMDSSEPLVPTSTRVQVLDSVEPLVLPLSSSEEPVADPSNIASYSNVAASAVNQLMPAASSLVDASDDEELPVDESSSRPLPSGSSGRRINYYSEEIRSMWNWRKIFMKLGSVEQCVQFAEERGLVPREKICTHHHRLMKLNADSTFGRFRCRKGNCRNNTYRRATGTWFEDVHLPLPTVMQLMYAFSEGLTYHQAQKQIAVEDEAVLSYKTIADWYSYCREVVVIFELDHQTADNKIGGPNKIVQIDELKFGRRKFKRGRHIEGHWVIGMIEDGSEDLRLEVCPDNERSAAVLVPLIQKHVQEGSIIHTDFWRAYDCLPEHGYIHKKVNHSDPTNKFVAPDGTHTQRIESQWRGLKKVFRQQHNKSDFTDWLGEYSWRRKVKINFKDPFEELLIAINYVYDNI